MRQHPLLRWIEQAEARRATDAACYEYRAVVSLEREVRRTEGVGARSRRWLRPLMRRLRPLRTADDFC